MRRLMWGMVLIGCAGLAALAQTSAVPQPPRLADFEGVYDYRDGATLFIVASGDRLFAILGDAKYPLRPAGMMARVLLPALLDARDASGRE